MDRKYIQGLTSSKMYNKTSSKMYNKMGHKVEGDRNDPKILSAHPSLRCKMQWARSINSDSWCSDMHHESK